MVLDERSALLLTVLQQSSVSKMSELENITGLTRRQIQYGISKVNDWLEFHEYEPICYDRRQGYSLTDTIRDEHLITKLERRQYVFSDKERETVFGLMILTSTEDLSVYHFESATGLSRNTVLSDLKRLKKKVETYQVEIVYTKQQGYLMKGDQLDKRYLLEVLVSEALAYPNRQFLLDCLWQTHESQIREIRQWLEELERRFGFTFTDERLDELCYLFLCTDQLLKRGETLQQESGWQQFLGTREYIEVSRLIDSGALHGRWNKTEKLYATLLVLSKNRAKDVSPFQGDETLYKLLEETVLTFERIAFVNFEDKDSLVQQLFVHFKPAYYRIMYGLTQVNPMAERICSLYPELHHMTKKSLKPLEQTLGKQFSEDEAAYFTVHFGGWLRKQGTRLDDRKRAIVVCPNGVGISNILIYTLREMFPDILFMDVLSVRDAALYELPYDLVFSTVYLRTNVPLFIIPAIPGTAEKQLLRQQVMQELYGYSTNGVNVQELLTIISDYATIHKFDELKKALNAQFNKQPAKSAAHSKKEAQKPVLEDLLNPKTIQLQPRVDDWKQAIRVAAQPLLDLGNVENRYVDAMISSIETNGPYVVITPDVAIPHARPEDGVWSLSMSLLKLDEPVYFSPEKPAQLIIVLAAADSDSHLRALIQLTQLLNERSNIDELIQATDKKQVMDLIHQYSKEETQ